MMMSTTLSMIWIASVAGALLFAASGFLAALGFRRPRRRESDAMDEAKRQATIDDQALLIRRLQSEVALLEEDKAQSLRMRQERQERVTIEQASSTDVANELAKCQRELVASKARVMTFEQVAKENAGLKKECATLRTRNQELQAAAALATARAKAAALPAPKRTFSDIIDDVKAASKNLDDNASLKRFVDDVLKTPSVSAVALTDELGFLVVGGGDHTEALAAFGAYLTDAGARACGLLPMHSVQRVSIQDDSGTTLTARTITTTPSDLVLVTLGVPGVPVTENKAPPKQKLVVERNQGDRSS